MKVKISGSSSVEFTNILKSQAAITFKDFSDKDETSAASLNKITKDIMSVIESQNELEGMLIVRIISSV
ncbi:MAG: hypothetical protein WCP46_03855 [Alphaproteobacteria bacterium]